MIAEMLKLLVTTLKPCYWDHSPCCQPFPALVLAPALALILRYQQFEGLKCCVAVALRCAVQCLHAWPRQLVPVAALSQPLAAVHGFAVQVSVLGTHAWALQTAEDAADTESGDAACHSLGLAVHSSHVWDLTAGTVRVVSVRFGTQQFEQCLVCHCTRSCWQALELAAYCWLLDCSADPAYPSLLLCPLS